MNRAKEQHEAMGVKGVVDPGAAAGGRGRHITLALQAMPLLTLADFKSGQVSHRRQARLSFES